MIDETLEQLMWEEIDGAIAPDDRRRLQEHLEKSPDARRRFDELREFSSLFNEAGEIAPPAVLRERIMGAIDSGRYAGAPALRASVWIRSRDGIARWLSGPGLRYATVAAAGVVVGVVGYHLATLDSRSGLGAGGAIDPARLRGTIVNGAGLPSGHAIKADGLEGTVSFHRQDRVAVSQIDLTSDGEVVVYLDYPGSPVEVRAVRSGSEGSTEAAISDGSVRIENRGGGRYRVTFESAGPGAVPLRIRVERQGRVVYEGEIPAAPGR